MFKRLLKAPKTSIFLFGPRGTGKSTWIRQGFKSCPYYDLLSTSEFLRLSKEPGLLYNELKGLQPRSWVVLDEIQKVPALLDEVHWLIANKNTQFLLTGSSARKLKRGHANLLGGRAWKRNMTPLSYLEVEGFDLEKVMVSGLLPPHFLSPQPIEDLRAYIADYLKEEIAAEALVQNIPAFSEFLRVAALTSSELLNYTNVGREAGVSAKVIRNYFQILEDTYLGFRVQPWKKSKNRRMIETEKFYLFDIGVAHYLACRSPRLGSYEFGKAFEHYILMELMAYKAYKKPETEISFWRTSTQQEVDFIMNDKEIAIEIKGSRRVHEGDIKGLKALLEDGPVKRAIIVCLEESRRTIHPQIEIIPWRQFLEELWQM